MYKRFSLYYEVVVIIKSIIKWEIDFAFNYS